MQEHVVLRTVIRLLIPFIFMFGLYIQFHGERSAGGGFQAGVICAVAFIAYGLIYDLERLLRVMPLVAVRALCSVGILLYGGVGLLAMEKGGKFLEYSVLLHGRVHAQELGIILVELGVGITVFSVMMLVFYMFAARG